MEMRGRGRMWLLHDVVPEATDGRMGMNTLLGLAGASRQG